MRRQSPLLIYGAGGSGRETAWLAEQCWEHGADEVPVAYLDDEAAKANSSIRGLPILTLQDAVRRYPRALFTAAVGNPATRAQLTERAKHHGFVEHTLVHPSVIRSRHIQFGRGVVVCAGTTLTTDIKLGDGVQININCTVSHDCVLDDYVTLAPGAHLCGNVHLRRGAYVGAGAVIKNGTPAEPLIIGAGTVIGAGACVTRSFGPSLTLVGVPASPLRKRVADAA